MEFSSQGCWSGEPFPPPADLSNPYTSIKRISNVPRVILWGSMSWTLFSSSPVTNSTCHYVHSSVCENWYFHLPSEKTDTKPTRAVILTLVKHFIIKQNYFLLRMAGKQYQKKFYPCFGQRSYFKSHQADSWSFQQLSITCYVPQPHYYGARKNTWHDTHSNIIWLTSLFGFYWPLLNMRSKLYTLE